MDVGIMVPVSRLEEKCPQRTVVQVRWWVVAFQHAAQLRLPSGAGKRERERRKRWSEIVDVGPGKRPAKQRYAHRALRSALEQTSWKNSRARSSSFHDREIVSKSNTLRRKTAGRPG